jgi:hypothetical protein
MCSRIIFLYKDKQLPQIISDCIVSHYKKLDPKDQAVWNTDMARFNYLICDVVENKDNWVVDKLGEKMKELIITPLAEEIRNYIFEHKNILCEEIISRNNTSLMIQKIQENINICFDILFFIDEKKFEYSICKIMAPKLYYKNNITTKMIENN